MRHVESGDDPDHGYLVGEKKEGEPPATPCQDVHDTRESGSSAVVISTQ
jgi:hypothetical protein